MESCHMLECYGDSASGIPGRHQPECRDSDYSYRQFTKITVKLPKESEMGCFNKKKTLTCPNNSKITQKHETLNYSFYCRIILAHVEQ